MLYNVHITSLRPLHSHYVYIFPLFAAGVAWFLLLWSPWDVSDG